MTLILTSTNYDKFEASLQSFEKFKYDKNGMY